VGHARVEDLVGHAVPAVAQHQLARPIAHWAAYPHLVRIVSRWNSPVAPQTDSAAMTPRMTAIPSAKAGLRTMTPTSWPKNSPSSGTTATAETCCAVRGSFTRDEIATQAAIMISASDGVQRISASSQPGDTIAASTCG